MKTVIRNTWNEIYSRHGKNGGWRLKTGAPSVATVEIFRPNLKLPAESRSSNPIGQKGAREVGKYSSMLRYIGY